MFSYLCHGVTASGSLLEPSTLDCCISKHLRNRFWCIYGWIIGLL